MLRLSTHTSGYFGPWHLLTISFYSESVSIPKNPRTDRPVGYAFVDLSTPSEAERAIAELSGKEILERKVSVQLARKPEAATDKAEGANGEHGEGTRRRQSTRGRGRAGRGRTGRGRGGRTGSGVSCPDQPRYVTHRCANSQPQDDEKKEETATTEGGAADASVAGEVRPPTTHIADEQPFDMNADTSKTQPKAPRERRERGPPADGIPSKNKVMVANLPYDLTEEKVCTPGENCLLDCH